MASTDSTHPSATKSLTRRSAAADSLVRFEVPPFVALAIALSIELGIVGLDLLLGPGEPLAAGYILGPFVVAFLSRTWVTAVAAATAVALAAASAIWYLDGTSIADVIRVAAVGVGGGIAVIATWLKRRNARSVGRLEILSAVGEVADGTLALADAVDRLCRRLVPAVGDVCVLDAVVDGEVRRLGVAASGPRARLIEEFIAARRPPGAGSSVGSTRAISSGEAQLVPRLTDEMLRGLAHDDEDLERLRDLRPLSAAIVPLRGRGVTIGALTLITADSGRTFDEDDFRFIGVVAGRAGLALDNAGLFRELSSVERQMDVVLRNLADAVTVQDESGALVYANQAAAEMMGLETPEELVGTPPGELVSRFVSFTEDGAPLDVERLPGRKVMKGEPADPLLVRALDPRTGEEHWRVVKSSPVHGPGGELALVVNVMEDVTEVKRAERDQRLLAESSRTLLGSLDYEVTLQQVAEMAVPDFADWCTVSLPRRDGIMEQVAVAHVDQEKVAFAKELNARYPSRLDEPGAGQVIRTGESVLTETPEGMLRESARDDEHFLLLRDLGLRSAVAAPIKGPEGPIGAITFVTAESGRVFGERDLRVAEELGRVAGAAIGSSRLYGERSAAANALEEALVPTKLPAIPAWDLSSWYRPASEGSQVGGDFYDAFPVPGGWMVVIGDVCGRGVEAASVTALARYTLRTAGSLSSDMITALTQLNSWLLDRGDGISLCSVATVMFNDAGDVQIACAGHPPPLLLRNRDVVSLEERGPILGMTEDASWPVKLMQLNPDDQLLLYTDGVIEFAGEAGRFGEGRLRSSIAGTRSADETVERVQAAHHAFSPEPWDDDIAMLSLMFEGTGSRMPGAPTGMAAG